MCNNIYTYTLLFYRQIICVLESFHKQVSILICLNFKINLIFILIIIEKCIGFYNTF